MNIYEMLEIMKETDGVEDFDSVEHVWKVRERAALKERGAVDNELEKYFEGVERKFGEYDKRFDKCAARKGIDTSFYETDGGVGLDGCGKVGVPENAARGAVYA